MKQWMIIFILAFFSMDALSIPPAVRAKTRSKKIEKRAREIAVEREIRIAVSELIADANRLYNKRRYYEALDLVDRALAMAPFLTRAWLMKGSLLYIQGHRELAKKSWIRARELDPKNIEAAYALEIYR